LGENEGERLARVETKIDMVLNKLDAKEQMDMNVEERLRNAELKIEKHSSNFKMIFMIGSASWAVILILVGKLFDWFGR
jgi:hypothetical protein